MDFHFRNFTPVTKCTAIAVLAFVVSLPEVWRILVKVTSKQSSWKSRVGYILFFASSFLFVLPALLELLHWPFENGIEDLPNRPLVILPIIGGAVVWPLVFASLYPLVNSKVSTSQFFARFVFPFTCMGVFLYCYSTHNVSFNQAMDKYMSSQLDRLALKQSIGSSTIRMAERTEVVRCPVLVLRTSGGFPDGSMPIGSEKWLAVPWSLTPWRTWYKYALPSNVVATVKKSGTNQLPTSLNFNGIVLVVEGAKESGRYIKLDVGAVPEMLQYADVFLLRTNDYAILARAPRIYGGPATRPRGPGVSYHSAVAGPNPDGKDIEDTIDNLVRANQ